MEKATQKKTQGTKPNCVTFDQGIRDGQSNSSKCSSFSSCSNDSTLSCSSHHVQSSNLEVGKRSTTESISSQLSITNGNSSGLSFSVSVPCVSDKDVKEATVIKSSSSTADFSTYVVQRFKEIGTKTVEEKTVMSSTKWQTFVPQDTRENTHHVSEVNNNSTKPEAKRRRRSEVEKLYDSLHEIEWAKNFSPDNILRQINIRKAASGSIFGCPSTSHTDSNEKSFKNQNEVSNHRHRSSTWNKSNRVKEKSKLITNNMEMPIPCSYKINNTKKRTTGSNSKKLISQKSDEATINKMITPKIEISSLNSNLCGKTDKGDSQSFTDEAIYSASHISKQEVSIKLSPESPKIISHSSSVNDNDQLPFVSIDSSSVSNNTGELPLDFQYKCKSNAGVINSLDISEYSVAPTNFYINEQGIHTINANFREVGADVVICTFNDKECDLLQLTSIADTDVSNKIPSDYSSPVLETCEMTDKKLLTLTCNTDTEKSMFDVGGNKKDNNCNAPFNKTFSVKDVDDVKDIYKMKKIESSKSHMPNKSSNNESICTEGRHILNKYLKYFRSKGKLSVPIVKQNKLVGKKSGLKKTVTKSINKCSQNDISIRKYNSAHNQDLIASSSISPSCSTSSMSFTSHELPCQTVENKRKGPTSSQTLNKKVSIYNYGNKTLTHQSGIKKTSCSSAVPKSRRCSYTKHTSVTSSSYLTTKTEKDTMHDEEHVPRPATSFSFTSPYKSIKISRNNSYTQVVLKPTRGRSVFLTLEALRELRDAVTRTASDSNSKVLVLTGSGDCFCLGLDLRPLVGPNKIKCSTDIIVAVKELIEALVNFTKPFVALVNGPAFGLGMTLLYHADVSIASDSATFCIPNCCLDYIPEGGATVTVPKVVGLALAAHLFFSGRTLSAEEARNLGLITDVTKANLLPHKLAAKVKMFTENPIAGFAATKEILKIPLRSSLQVILDIEVKLLPYMWLTKSSQEAMRSALRFGVLSE